MEFVQNGAEDQTNCWFEVKYIICINFLKRINITWEFLFPGPIPPVSDNIRSFAGTSYPPIAKSNEGCPHKAPYVKNTFFILISIKFIQKPK
jgi:hypothetical protein